MRYVDEANNYFTYLDNFILAACSNDKDKSSDQEADHTKGSHSSQVKQVATDKTYKAIIIVRFYHLKKVNHVGYYKIIWQIAITVKALRVVC